MIGKIIGAVICFTVVLTPAGAQELGVELAGGLQGMEYQVKNGDSKLLPGAALGVSYTIGLTDHLGLVTGLTAGFYRTQATLQDGRYTYGQVDQVGSAFQYNLKTTGYREVQHFYAASIPVLLQYRTAGNGPQWYINGGGKIFLPFGSSAAVTVKQLGLSGYYPDLNLQVSNLPQHGFGTVNNWKGNASFSLKPSVAFSAGTGVSFDIASGRRLYAGVFVDLGVTNLKNKMDSMPLMTYSPTGVGGAKASGVLNMPNAGKPTLFGFGLQVRLSFGGAKAKPRVHHKVDSTVHAVQVFEVHQENIVTTPTTKPAGLSEDEVDLIQTPVVFGVVGGTLIPALQRDHLDQVAELMKQHPEIKLVIVGHMCNSGDETEGSKVGMARAVAIQKYLESKGINKKSKRIEVSAAAENDQEEQGDPAANYWKRRVEIRVQ